MTCYMSQDTVEPVAYLMASLLSSRKMGAAQSRFIQVLLKDDCTCINASIVIIPGEAVAVVDWDSLTEQNPIEEI